MTDTATEMAAKFSSVIADIVEKGGNKALVAAALTLVEIVASEIPEDAREYFLMEVLRSFADGIGGEVKVSDEVAPSRAGGLH